MHSDLTGERQLVSYHWHCHRVVLRLQQAITALFKLETTGPLSNGVATLLPLLLIAGVEQSV